MTFRGRESTHPRWPCFLRRALPGGASFARSISAKAGSTTSLSAGIERLVRRSARKDAAAPVRIRRSRGSIQSRPRGSRSSRLLRRRCPHRPRRRFQVPRLRYRSFSPSTRSPNSSGSIARRCIRRQRMETFLACDDSAERSGSTDLPWRSGFRAGRDREQGDQLGANYASVMSGREP